MNLIRKSVATVAAAGTILGGGMAAPAFAQPEQRGLVNVVVIDNEDGKILSDNNVGVGVAANVAAAVCGVRVNVAVLSILEDVVDEGGTYECDAENDDSSVIIEQAQ